MASKGLPNAFAVRILFGGVFSFALGLAASPNDMTSTLLIGGARIDVSIEQGNSVLPEADVIHWVQSAAESVAAYYGRFPVPHLTLRISSSGGRGARGGRTFAREDGGLIVIRVGSNTTPSDFAEDWILTHEMVHLAFPSFAENQHWIEEGSATYVEPIARIHAGHWTAVQMWSELLRDMPKGLPKKGDEGLDHTHTWGRTYWGGALFCFVEDVEIRKQTRNKKGLEDALRGILEAGGDIRKDWELEDALRIGDKAVGVNVLQKLYAEMKDRPVQVDLPSIWKQLGIEGEGESIHFNEDAPLAEIRRSITDGSGGKKQAGKSAAASTPPMIIFAGRTTGSR